MKKIFLIVLISLIMIVSCSSQLNRGTAENGIRNNLRLTKEDKIEILGISEESKTIKFVKFLVNNQQSNARFRKYDQGWQMDEVQIPSGQWLPVTMIKSGDEDLKRLDIKVKTIWEQVDTVYQKRAELVSRLIEAVKEIEKNEREIIVGLLSAQNKLVFTKLDDKKINDPKAFKIFQQSQDELGSAISRLLAAVEKYPNIKASQNFRALLNQLEGTENRITIERQRYNEAVLEYNSVLANSYSGKTLSDKPFFRSYSDGTQQKVIF